jgi:Asp-tRNA(Asn)/Glu-tRNA(Gln) amidotransferase C subunit
MLAELVGISIDDSDLPEVANRFGTLMQELDRLRELDLEGLEPVTIFPDTEFPDTESSETGSDD